MELIMIDLYVKKIKEGTKTLDDLPLNLKTEMREEIIKRVKENENEEE